jgi:hypothetical protein
MYAFVNTRGTIHGVIMLLVSCSDAGESRPVDVISYGQLDMIVVCELGEHKIYRFLCNTTLILVLITLCNTDGIDASISLVEYKEFVTPVVTDVQNINVVVGQVQTQGETFIIDQWLASGGNKEIGNSSDTSNSG